MARSATSSKPSARADEARIDGDRLLDIYRQMLLVRRFEEKVGQMYGMGLIGGFCHLYIGQEAVVVGMHHATRPGDAFIASYRCHGHCLVRGMPPEAVMAELTGRAAGVSKGKGGSMHMFDPDRGFFGGHGIVAAQVPLGAGLAFAFRYRGSDNVAVVFFGEGAANQGQVYETFNMAGLWRLPVVFVIENNQYAMGTSIERAKAGTALHRRGEAFGIRGVRADGMDVEEVHAAGLDAIAHCRAGKGPVLLELRTYRYRGHSMSDPAKYRSRDEVREMRARHDPIDRLRTRIGERGLADEAALRALDRRVKAEVAAAAEFAQTSPEPPLETLRADIHAAPVPAPGP